MALTSLGFAAVALCAPLLAENHTQLAAPAPIETITVTPQPSAFGTASQPTRRPPVVIEEQGNSLNYKCWPLGHREAWYWCDSTGAPLAGPTAPIGSPSATSATATPTTPTPTPSASPTPPASATPTDPDTRVTGTNVGPGVPLPTPTQAESSKPAHTPKGTPVPAQYPSATGGSVPTTQRETSLQPPVIVLPSATSTASADSGPASGQGPKTSPTSSTAPSDGYTPPVQVPSGSPSLPKQPTTAGTAAASGTAGGAAGAAPGSTAAPTPGTASASDSETPRPLPDFQRQPTETAMDDTDNGAELTAGTSRESQGPGAALPLVAVAGAVTLALGYAFLRR